MVMSEVLLIKYKLHFKIKNGVLLVVLPPLYAPFSRSFAEKSKSQDLLFSIQSEGLVCNHPQGVWNRRRRMVSRASVYFSFGLICFRKCDIINSPKIQNLTKVVAMDVIDHYDLLIEEQNDPFRDLPVLQEYMSKWDGVPFLEALELSKDKSVLEIGIGTGRIAVKVAPCCLKMTGIDISPKTIERAKDNLKEYGNISFVCSDFNSHEFDETFDVIYSSLTMMHFENKAAVITKIVKLLKDNGIFCLSIDKNQSEYIDMGTRKIKVYPDTLDNITSLIGATSMSIVKTIEIDNAHIIVSRK